MRSALGTFLALVLLAPAMSFADYLEVSRNATLKDLPESEGTVLDQLKRGDILQLLEDEQTNGYYHAQPGAGGHAGWIYRTLVRRYAGDPPSTGFPSQPSQPAQPAAGGDASAYAIHGCPPEGNARSQSDKANNRLKNRTSAPLSSAVHVVNISAVEAPGDDTNRWNSDDAVELTGYVASVKAGGPETCNCKSTDPADYDTHIELTSGPNDTGLPVIVEVTPSWRGWAASQGRDWSTSTLASQILHQRIRVRGWLFFDSRHRSNSENTNPDGEDELWRRTAWEVHPVTDLVIVPNP